MMDEFLGWLFPDAVSPAQRIVLFTVPEKRARFFDNPSTAQTAARKLSLTQDVYFGVGLIQGTPRGRGKRDDVGGIGALWADVDFAGSAHPDKALPQGDEDFERLLAELPLPPSIVIDSGHGRHLYWLLQEPWLLANAQERQRAAQLAHDWHEVICVAARRLGWSLENLGDLTRILRLPETFNRKQANAAREVRVLAANPDRRYALNDFENFFPEPASLPAVPSPMNAAPAIELTAEPPADKLQAALMESPLSAKPGNAAVSTCRISRPARMTSVWPRWRSCGVGRTRRSRACSWPGDARTENAPRRPHVPIISRGRWHGPARRQPPKMRRRWTCPSS